jgi:hypothetical protein
VDLSSEFRKEAEVRLQIIDWTESSKFIYLSCLMFRTPLDLPPPITLPLYKDMEESIRTYIPPAGFSFLSKKILTIQFYDTSVVTQRGGLLN